VPHVGPPPVGVHEHATVRGALDGRAARLLDVEEEDVARGRGRSVALLAASVAAAVVRAERSARGLVFR
jgi:hypothetical protein